MTRTGIKNGPSMRSKQNCSPHFRDAPGVNHVFETFCKINGDLLHSVTSQVLGKVKLLLTKVWSRS